MIKKVSTARFALIKLSLLIFFVIFSLFLPVSSPAIVTGVCSNCHTMHNSQNGTTVARENAGWNGGVLTGGTDSGPLNQLLVTNCVGCHTSTTSSTIVNFGGSKIPIVFNTNGYPADALAGGNFYYVAQGSSSYGHNVYGVAGPDTTLTYAPGRQAGTCGTGSCHYTLAVAPSSVNYSRGGCQGCHVFTSHHNNKGWYRFLKGHSDPPFDPGSENASDHVIGIGDPRWEQPSTREAGHNWYKGTGDPYTSPESEGHALQIRQTITSFCSGCHGQFHNQFSIDGGAYTSPWKRHPTDILLNDKGGEYTGYDTVGSYSLEAPVAWIDPASPTKATAVVMCLSCHRPHGSNQPDMLRWDYSTMVAGNGSANTGCFTCHTTKNDAP